MELEKEFNEFLKEKGLRYFKSTNVDSDKFFIDTYGVGNDEWDDDETRQMGYMSTFSKIYPDNSRYQKMILTIS